MRASRSSLAITSVAPCSQQQRRVERRPVVLAAALDLLELGERRPALAGEEPPDRLLRLQAEAALSLADSAEAIVGDVLAGDRTLTFAHDTTPNDR